MRNVKTEITILTASHCTPDGPRIIQPMNNRESCFVAFSPKNQINSLLSSPRAESARAFTPIREGCEKSKWKFKMAFVIYRGTIRDMRVPKVLLPPPSKIGLLAQKRQNIFHFSVSTLKIAQKRFPQLRFTYIGAQ